MYCIIVPSLRHLGDMVFRMSTVLDFRACRSRSFMLSARFPSVMDPQESLFARFEPLYQIMLREENNGIFGGLVQYTDYSYHAERLLHIT